MTSEFRCQYEQARDKKSAVSSILEEELPLRLSSMPFISFSTQQETKAKIEQQLRDLKQQDLHKWNFSINPHSKKKCLSKVSKKLCK